MKVKKNGSWLDFPSAGLTTYEPKKEKIHLHSTGLLGFPQVCTLLLCLLFRACCSFWNCLSNFRLHSSIVCQCNDVTLEIYCATK